MDVFADHPWKLAAMAVLLAASAFFSSSETALFALRKRRLAEFRQSRSRLQRVAARLMRDPGATVITILFGNMTVNVLFYAIGSYFFYEFSPQVRGVLALVTLLAVVIFGEVVPKAIAFAHAEAWAPVTAPVIAVLHKLLLPVRWLLSRGFIRPITRLLLGGADTRPAYATPEELRGLVAATARDGGISPDEHALLAEVIQLGELIVRDVMIPRVDVIGIDADAPTADYLRLVRRHRLTKLPIYEKDLDHVLGLVYAKDAFLRPESRLRQLARPVQFVPELTRVEALLEQFRSTRTQFAVVVDEYGGVAGIVTVEDIVEELIGQIGHDRGEVAAEITSLGKGVYRVPGSLGMHEWAEQFGEDPSEGKNSTIGGYVTALLGRPARVDDTVRGGGFEFVIESIRRRRVLRMRARRSPADPGEKGGRP
jgi:CBS domain containing-hemolysin-like protein